MKFNKSHQLALVSAAGLIAASLVTACSQFTETLTVDFVYVASAAAAGTSDYGEIEVYEINSESGAMRKIPASPFPSGGRDPVAETVSADYSSLFVANQDDNTVVQFVIGSDGKLYPYLTVNTVGIFPVALAADKSNLYSVALYQPLANCSTAAPCSGAIAVFPLSTGSSSSNAPCTLTVCLGSPAVNSTLGEDYWPLTLPSASNDVIVPTAVNVLANGSDVYVTAYDSSVSPSVGYVFGFSVGNGGVLTPLNGGNPFVAGVHPSAIASDSTSSYVYVTDYKSGTVLGFSVSSGNLTPLTSGTGGTNKFAAGNGPSGIVIDPSYPYAYVTNALDASVMAYSMSNGALTNLGTYTTGLQPGPIGIDPSTNRFLFTANFLGSNISGFQIDTTDGTLLLSQYSPYASSAQPVAVAAIPHNGTGAGIQP